MKITFKKIIAISFIILAGIISANVGIHAITESDPIYYEVYFDPGFFGVIDESGPSNYQIVEAGGSAESPIVSTDEGWNFIGWYYNGAPFSLDNINQDIDLIAWYEAQRFTVNFHPGVGGSFDPNGPTSTQVIDYGWPAEPPIVIPDQGYTFIGWDVDFSEVTSNLEITALYSSLSEAPVINEIKAGENKITGTASKTGTVEITLPSGSKATTSVTAGTPFTVNISPLKVGEKVSAVSIDSNGIKSAIVNKTVVMRALDEPALNVIYDNEQVMKGRSFHTGTITVTFYDGTKYVQNVVAGEDFSITINKTLTAGEKFTVEGKDAYLNEIPLMDLAVAKSHKNFSGVYTIKSKKSGLLMDVYGGGKEKGTNVIQWPATGGMNQKWKFEKLDTGYYKITSVLNPNFSLDVYGGGKAEGTKVIQWPYHGGINQQWKITEYPDGSIALISRLSVENQTYYALDVFGGGTTPGVNVIQWKGHDGDNQRWYLDNVVQEFPETSKDYTGTYGIKSKNSGLSMDVYGGGKTQGVNIIQWPPHGRSNQQWKFERLNNGYYKITSVLSGLSIDVYGGGAQEGNRVIQWPYHGGSNQQWRIIENSDGSISLMSKLSEETYNYFLLDVFGGGKDHGVNVIQWSGHYRDNQKWMLQEVDK